MLYLCYHISLDYEALELKATMISAPISAGLLYNYQHFFHTWNRTL